MSTGENMMEKPVWNSPTDAGSTEGAKSEAADVTPAAPSGDGAQDKAPAAEAAKTEATPAKENAEPAKKAEPTPFEPSTRKMSKMDFIMARKQRQATKQQQQQVRQDDAKGESNDDGQGDDFGDDQGTNPADADTVKKVVEDQYSEYFEEIERTRLNNEIDQAIAGSRFASEFTPEEKQRFKDLAMHPAYREVWYEAIETLALGKSRLMEMGAKIEREAAEKSAASKIGGGTTTSGGEKAPVDWLKMTDEEFAKEKARVLGRPN